MKSKKKLNYFDVRCYWSGGGLWLSVDPLADERPHMSQYAYVQGNPLNRVDGQGLLDDIYIIFENGGIVKYEEYAYIEGLWTRVNINFNEYFYYTRDGFLLELGKYPVLLNRNNEEMIKVGEGAFGENAFFKWIRIASGNLFVEEDAFAAFLGGTMNFYRLMNSNGIDVEKLLITQFMSINREHSSKKDRHNAIDIAYYTFKGTTGGLTDEKKQYCTASRQINQKLFESFRKFGLGDRSFTSMGEKSYSAFLDGTSGYPGHHHLHLENIEIFLIKSVKKSIVVIE